MTIRAVIFDLDGVIVSTDECHFQAWKRMADEEGIYFDSRINLRLRGVSRMASLEVILERAERSYTDEEKKDLAARKNGYYRELITALTPDDILAGAMPFMEECKKRGLKIAVGSSSKNTPLILERIGLSDYFDAVSDGNDITRSKPDPQVFLIAARRLGIDPHECLVIEDADAGVEAACAGGMKALGVGTASRNPAAHITAAGLHDVTVDAVCAL